MLGLKRNIVELFDHQDDWEAAAEKTISELKTIFGNTALDIQHVGSSAIRHIKAKPIIDIAVGIQSFDALTEVLSRLDASGIYKSAGHDVSDDLLYVIDDYENGTRTHHIHIVLFNSDLWHNYINFRDYLNAFPEKALAYENLKIELAKKYSNDRISYTDGKKAFITECLFKANIFAEMRRKIDITVFSKINKGWSNDKKYYIETSDCKKFLLRVADIEEYDRKKAEFDMMKRVFALSVPMSDPIDFGICKGGKYVYSLLKYCDGEDAETILPGLSEAGQYSLGLKAGKLLQKIHTIPAPKNAEPWAKRFYRKVRGRIDFYEENPIRSKNGDIIIRYLQDKKNVLDGRTQTFNHGDYNISNLIVSPDGQIAVIDFNYFNLDYGDPWWEFDSISWGKEPPAHFYTGLIKGYFNGEPPADFFEVLSYYFAYDALAALCDTSKGEQGEPEDGLRHMENILRWFDNMNNYVPTWYIKDFN